MFNVFIVITHILIVLSLILINPFLAYSEEKNNYFNQLNIFKDLFDKIEENIYNLTKSLEYNIEIQSNQVFPNETIKDYILDNKEPVEYIIPILRYNLLGFEIFATDIKVVAIPKQINVEGKNKTRLDFPIMNASNVRIKNNMINLAFVNVDMSSTYLIYDSEKDKLSIYIPIHVAARYLPN